MDKFTWNTTMNLKDAITLYNSEETLKKEATSFSITHGVFCRRTENGEFEQWVDNIKAWVKYTNDAEFVPIPEFLSCYENLADDYRLDVQVWDGATSFHIPVKIQDMYINDDGVIEHSILEKCIIDNKDKILKILWDNIVCRIRKDDDEEVDYHINRSDKNYINPTSMIKHK